MSSFSLFNVVGFLLISLSWAIASPEVSSDIKATQCASVFEGDKKIVKVSDIQYWDVDEDTTLSKKERDAMKAMVIKQLGTVGNRISNEKDEICSCPRIFGPVICDQRGVAHVNVCTFGCEQRKMRCNGNKGEPLHPVKVLMRVSPGDEEEKCKL